MNVLKQSRPLMRLEYLQEYSINEIESAINGSWNILKRSKKALIGRHGKFVLKKRPGRNGIETVKHIAENNRNSWDVALKLITSDVSIALPVAFAVYGLGPLHWASITVTRFIEGAMDIEAFADQMVAREASEVEIASYLAKIAAAVNKLNASGVYHNDLAGKNILTTDGSKFYFIDLDGIEMDRPYDREHRMRNHVQLYDSLNDRWGDSQLVPFIEQMMGPESNTNAWLDELKRRQQTRRQRTEAIWRKQGRLQA